VTSRKPKKGSGFSRRRSRRGKSRKRPIGASQGVSPWRTRKRAGATSSDDGQPSRSQEKVKKLSERPYHGSRQ
jgi:hypothetical protein